MLDEAKALERLSVTDLPKEWTVSRVCDACSIRNELRLPLSVEVRQQMRGEFPYYGPTGVLDHINEYRIEGDFALIGEDGDHFLDVQSKPQTVRVSGRFNVNNHAHVISSGDACEVDWFCYFFQHRDIYHALTRQGAGRFKLTKAALEHLPILLPPLPEQRKIAEILRTWDEAIDACERLIDRLDKRFRATARRLFDPCHPTFERRPNSWGEFELGDVFTERTESGSNDDRLLSITMSDGIIDREEVGRKDTSTEDKSSYKLILPGDIGYNTMRMWQGVSGLSTLRGIVSPAYTIVTADNTNIDAKYAAHLFKSRRMVFDFERYSQGLTSDTWNLKFPAFSRIKLFLPPIDLQRKQALLLDEMQAEIAVIRRKRDVLADQKRGLMQKLLTGAWRVVV